MSQFCKIHPRGLQDGIELWFHILSHSQCHQNQTRVQGFSGAQFPSTRMESFLPAVPTGVQMSRGLIGGDRRQCWMTERLLDPEGKTQLKWCSAQNQMTKSYASPLPKRKIPTKAPSREENLCWHTGSTTYQMSQTRTTALLPSSGNRKRCGPAMPSQRQALGAVPETKAPGQLLDGIPEPPPARGWCDTGGKPLSTNVPSGSPKLLPKQSPLAW